MAEGLCSSKDGSCATIGAEPNFERLVASKKTKPWTLQWTRRRGERGDVTSSAVCFQQALPTVEAPCAARSGATCAELSKATTSRPQPKTLPIASPKLEFRSAQRNAAGVVHTRGVFAQLTLLALLHSLQQKVEAQRTTGQCHSHAVSVVAADVATQRGAGWENKTKPCARHYEHTPYKSCGNRKSIALHVFCFSEHASIQINKNESHA